MRARLFRSCRLHELQPQTQPRHHASPRVRSGSCSYAVSLRPASTVGELMPASLPQSARLHAPFVDFARAIAPTLPAHRAKPRDRIVRDRVPLQTGRLQALCFDLSMVLLRAHQKRIHFLRACLAQNHGGVLCVERKTPSLKARPLNAGEVGNKMSFAGGNVYLKNRWMATVR